MPKITKQKLNQISQTNFLNNLHRAYYTDIDLFLNDIEYVPIIKTNKKEEIFNCPCSLDIETSSFYQQDEKRAIMYIWMFGFNGRCLIGRTWNDLIYLFEQLQHKFDLNDKRKIYCYIHNLAYEFQFIRKHIKWLSVFAISQRKPVKALSEYGIEFRCSYILTNKSLAKVGEDLHTYHVEKLSGDLDYSLIRHSKTPLTDTEINYCINDIKVVMCLIQECIESESYNISRIPLTNTGYVRRYMRKCCLSNDAFTGKPDKSRWFSYRRLMSDLTLEVDEYKMLKQAFQGGFTHASAWYSTIELQNVGSFDFTSDYPAILIGEKFPMDKGELYINKNQEDFDYNIDNYCCLFDMEIFNLQERIIFEHPISSSKCRQLTNPVIDNGRIVSADHLIITVTEQDFKIYKKWYKWNSFRIGRFYRYKKGYLPKHFVEGVLKLYKDKTILKDVKGRELDYNLNKAMLNSTYGMTVTDIVRASISYGDDWIERPCDYDESIKKYNESMQRFLFYPWGVWTTAYARSRLFNGIAAAGSDYVYSDTDSIKILNPESHIDYIERFNEALMQHNKNAMLHHKLPVELIEPETLDGIKKPIGIWDFEGVYQRFKTLGAKRYLTYKDNEYSLTVSGLNKKDAMPYICKKYKDPFKAFDDSLYVPKGYTGKMIHTYLDEAQNGIVIDYMNNAAEYHELSSVHMEEADYSLSLPIAYINYLEGLREEIEYF